MVKCNVCVFSEVVFCINDLVRGFWGNLRFKKSKLQKNE